VTFRLWRCFSLVLFFIEILTSKIFNGRQQPGSRRSQSCRPTELRKSPLPLSLPGRDSVGEDDDEDEDEDEDHDENEDYDENEDEDEDEDEKEVESHLLFHQP